MAPNWIRIAKVLPNRWSPKPKKCSTRSRCPVDDTGMYSVRPSTMPRQAALKISTNMGRNSVANGQSCGIRKDGGTVANHSACGATRPVGQGTAWTPSQTHELQQKIMLENDEMY